MTITNLKELATILWYLFLICILLYFIIAVVISIAKYVIKQIKYEQNKKDLINIIKDGVNEAFTKDKK